MNALSSDVRLAARGFRRRPGLTLVSTLTLAFGIGGAAGAAARLAVVFDKFARPAVFGEVRVVGTGPTPLILMPCLGCDWRAFDEFMERNKERYVMYSVTWPGMGRTALPDVRRSTSVSPLLDNVIDATLSLIRERRIERPILVAHSAAAPLAVRFAAEHPELLGGVVSVDAIIQNNDTLGFSPGQRRAWADAEMEKVLGQYDNEEAWRRLNTPAPHKAIRPSRLEMYKDMWLTPPRAHVFRYWREWLGLDAGSRLAGLRVPLLALFAVGEQQEDPQQFMTGLREQFRRNGASASVRIEFIQPATHSIWETRPEAFDAALQRFAKECERGPTEPGAPAPSEDKSVGCDRGKTWAIAYDFVYLRMR